MNVTLYSDYLEAAKHRKQLDGRLKALEKDRNDADLRLQSLMSQVCLDSFITSKAVKTINKLLTEKRPLTVKGYGESLPVSYARLSLSGNQLRVNIVFSQPIFKGWRTETPYLSYQSCALSLTTPAPNENHIPEYLSVIDWELPAICWELTDDAVTLWTDEERGVRFSWRAE